MDSVVDSPNPVTLHFVLASLSNWREGQRNTYTTQRQSLGLISHPRPPSTPASTDENLGEPQNENMSESTSAEMLPGREVVIAGSLVVEEYSWKSIQSGKFVLRLTTTGTTGTSITLLPGLVRIY